MLLRGLEDAVSMQEMVGLTMQRPLLCASSPPAETTSGASEDEEEEGTQAQETAKPPV